MLFSWFVDLTSADSLRCLLKMLQFLHFSAFLSFFSLIPILLFVRLKKYQTAFSIILSTPYTSKNFKKKKKCRSTTYLWNRMQNKKLQKIKIHKKARFFTNFTFLPIPRSIKKFICKFFWRNVSRSKSPRKGVINEEN